jgi:hypothetical protein
VASPNFCRGKWGGIRYHPHRQIDEGLADEYEAAQERGEVKGNGGDRVSTVAKQNSAPSADDVGLSRQEIHEARIIRDAELIEPGIVRRTLDSSLEFSNLKLRPSRVGTAAPRARYLRLAHPVQG